MNTIESVDFSQLYKLYELLTDNVIWQRQFYRGLSNIEDDAIVQLRDNFIVLQTTIENYLNDDKLVKQPEIIVNALQVDINRIVQELIQQMSEQTNQLIHDIEQSTELTLQAEAVSNLTWEQNRIEWQKIHVTNVQKLDSSWRIARETVYNATTGSMTGTLIGGAIGSVFIGMGAVPGAILGAQLGGLFGASSGAYGAVSGIHQQKMDLIKQLLSKKIYQFINLNESQCTNNIRSMVRQLRQNLDMELTKQIEQQKALFEQSCTKLPSKLLNQG
ncbi:MAG: glycine zipper family protein, partial [Thiotrichaceae bacterium]|nr:glycine zipper family protein [Thiotrichaceae bacterium]